MFKKHSSYNSSEIIQRSEILIKSASNRYQMTVRVANRAKHYRYDDFENFDSPAMKPVIRAIIEMTDELAELNFDNEFTETITKARGSDFKTQSRLIEPSTINSIPPSLAPSIPPPSPPTTPPSAISSATPSVTLESTNCEIASQINIEVDTNPQLQQLKQESNSNAWNKLIEWIGESAYNINYNAAAISGKKLKLSYQDKSPREIARVLIVQKSVQAAGVDLIRGIPKAEDILRGIAGYDLPAITKLAAEMVYQIAAIYGFDLQEPARKTEALVAFGAAFLGEKAIAAGIDWLKCSSVPGLIISAGAKALMIYAVGNAACLFYEAKLKAHFNSKLNPLVSPLVLNEVRRESQQYLASATSEAAIIKIVSTEITIALTIDYTKLRDLLKTKKWKQADLETCNILLKIANRDAEGSLKKIATEDLRIINQLWLTNSNSHFGFGAQKQIYLSVSKDVAVFGEKIGWRGEAGLLGGILGWKQYARLTFDSDKAPKGHLPAAFCLTLPWRYHKGEVTRDFAESILQRNDW